MSRDISRLLYAICFIGGVYDRRFGEGEESIRIAVQTGDGQRQYGSYPVPLSALDDVIKVLEDLKRKRVEENTEWGINQELRGNRDLKKLDEAPDPEALRAKIRGNYEEAARRAEQPEDLPH